MSLAEMRSKKYWMLYFQRRNFCYFEWCTCLYNQEYVVDLLILLEILGCVMREKRVRL